MFFSKAIAFVSLTLIGLVAAQSDPPYTGSATLAGYTAYPSTLNCGLDCPISGLWFADLEGLVLDYECGTLIQFTNGDNTITAPYCDFAEGNTPEPSGLPYGGSPTLVVPPAVLGELGDSTGAELTVTYVFPAPTPS